MLWPFKETLWDQEELLKRFKLDSLFGKKCEEAPIAPLDVLIGAKSHPLNGVPCEKSVFPVEFNNCPYCGSELIELEENIAPLWIPPYGSGNGLKLFSIKKSQKNKTGSGCSTASKFVLPSRDGHFAFCSVKLGATKRLLVTIKRDIGQIWVYRTDDNKWTMLSGNFGGDSLPVWSWSLAVDSLESGLCIPTDQGPVWVTANWATGSVQVDQASGKSVGGAVCLGKYIMAPILRGDKFTIAIRKEGEKNWSECSSLSEPLMVLPQLRRNSSQDACLGIPVVDENRNIVYWPGRGGYIRVLVSDSAGSLSWEFKKYETDTHPATALIELGPPYRRTGSRSGFWQLCEDHDESVRDGIVNKIIKLDGDEQIDSELVECGQFLTTGRASFSWGDDYWDDIHKRNPRIGEQPELRFPLLQFGEKGLALIAKVRPWEGRDELGVFSDLFFNRDVKTSTFVRFVVEGSGVPEKALLAEGVDGVDGAGGSLFRIKVAEIPELSVFINGDHLHIYLPETNDCYSWPLEFLEG